ncbi:hypothetical protein BBP40_000371 [Aspergillus hancockii]|nr:hypothetical protein BBP40_000371 [Aspergillus hancockii]
MYFSKVIYVAFLAALTGAAAAPSGLEARSSDACKQALSALEQTAQYYKVLGDQWNGNAGEALKKALTRLDSGASDVKQACADLEKMEKSQHESYSSSDSQISDMFS